MRATAGAPLCEDIDDRARQAAELAQCFNKRWTTDVRNIGERYAKGYVELHVGVRVPSGDWVAVLKRAVPKGDQSDRSHPGWLDLASFDAGHVQLPVLVLKVEVMEGVERYIPSTVRFEREDSVPIGLGEAPYLPPHAPLSESVFCLGEREARVRWLDVSDRIKARLGRAASIPLSSRFGWRSILTGID